MDFGGALCGFPDVEFGNSILLGQNLRWGFDVGDGGDHLIGSLLDDAQEELDIVDGDFFVDSQEIEHRSIIASDETEDLLNSSEQFIEFLIARDFNVIGTIRLILGHMQEIR